MKHIISILHFLLMSIVMFGQTADFGIGAKARGLGGASIALEHDVWSATNSQAQSAWNNSPEIGAFYEQGYMLKELSLLALCGVLPFWNGSFSTSMIYRGHGDYNEMLARLAYAMRLSTKISVSVGFDYLTARALADDYRGNMFTFELGASYKPNDRLNFAFHTFNPIGTKASGEGYMNEKLSVYRGGGAFLLSEFATILTEVEYSNDYKTVAKVGLLLSFEEKYEIYGGFNTYPNQLSFGLGYTWRDVKIDFYSHYHFVLGYTPGLSFSYQFGTSRALRDRTSATF
ncbi:MAG: hypothetical protein ACK5L5_06620 [Bacteroidales bacterium]